MWSLLLSTLALAACGGSGGPSQSGYARHLLTVGRLPNGQGFGIWVQRNNVRGKDHVRVIATIVPAAPSIDAIRKEINRGRYGRAEINLDRLKPPDDLVGLVGCTAHPVVLLYGLSYGFTSASLRADGQGQALRSAQLPPDFGFKLGGVAWGFLTRGATLRMRDNTGQVFWSQTYPAPPTYQQCHNGTETITYAS